MPMQPPKLLGAIVPCGTITTATTAASSSSAAAQIFRFHA